MKNIRTLLTLLFLVIISVNLSAQTASEWLIKAEDTFDPQECLTFANKALELAGNDIVSKIAAKATIADYHCYKHEAQEAEQLINEISQLVKNTTDIYANYKYQNAQGDLFFVKEDYVKATSSFEKALEHCIKLGKPYYIKLTYQYLAESNIRIGKPLIAIDNCRKGISVTADERSRYIDSDIYNKISLIYDSQGKNKEAIDEYLKALQICESLNLTRAVAHNLMSIAYEYDLLGDSKSSIDYYQQAIKKYEELGLKDFLIECYSRLSKVIQKSSTGTRAEVVRYAQKAYDLAKGMGDKTLIMKASFTLAYAVFDFNAESQMLARLTEGYNIAKEIDDKENINLFENYIGMYHDIRGDFDLAIPFYQSRVLSSEKSRASVPDEQKLDYWKLEYGGYQNIIGCQLHLKDYSAVINSIEKSTARLLFEHVAAKSGKSNVSTININEVYGQIPSNQAVIFYGNAGLMETSILTANSSGIGGKLVNSDMWLKTIQNKYTITTNSSFEQLRAFKRIKDQSNSNKEVAKPNQEQIVTTAKNFEDIVNHYRSLLSKPIKDQADKDALDFLGRKFYQLLVKPIEDKLVDKTELLIIPNDVMAFLPYEAFIMSDGRYLVEKYDIRYLPSYSLGVELAKRIYPDTRKPILAFGNAIYDVPSTQTYTKPSPTEFGELMSGVQESANKGENMKRYYNALGYAWDNLSGTQAEVDAILVLQPTATLVRGKDVNKQNVIQMSQKGLLKNYKILHFATHGVVIPEFQELSAIVLTQGLTTDDGYLRASEVAKLNINADFVNLSACETGLGKIYGGEGVVGLTQSFLLAGANSVTVSLWQVSDASTMEFQKELYRLVFTEKMPVSKAINQVKRKFITEGQYKHPFYWAPFVYYGM